MEAVGFLAALAIVGAGIWWSTQQAQRRQREERERLKAFVAGVESTSSRSRAVTVEAKSAASAASDASGGTVTATVGTSAHVEVTPAEDLPTFADIGGMDDLKTHLRDTIGLLRARPDDAEAYGLRYGGLLLHGPPGTGKSHMARCLAGEFGLRLVHVSTGDLVEGIVGASGDNVRAVFDLAGEQRPCVLFLDEFDSIAQRRESAGHAEERRTVNQLLVAVEQAVDDPDVVIVAATNDLDHLDPAVVRSGRFDRHVRVDLPDRAAREAILRVHLADRPTADIDVAAVADRTEGSSAADMAALVDDAALHAFTEASQKGEAVLVTTDHLLDALRRRGGTDRPTVEGWSWDDLVLAPRVLAELQQVEALLAEPDLARSLGVDPPRGVLLAGPPGTGKTTIARVLAAQARCSFYPVSGADVTSRWHGESERSIARLFDRARANRPSIVFIDEIDTLGGHRGGSSSDAGDRQLTQLLVEIDGLTASSGLLVIGATNRPDALDPALTRGGRLGRTIEITLPDVAGRRRLLDHFTRRMPTVGVNLDAVAEATTGMSGADLKAMCQQAALQALVRARADGDGDAAVEVLPEDFGVAVAAARNARQSG